MQGVFFRVQASHGFFLPQAFFFPWHETQAPPALIVDLTACLWASVRVRLLGLAPFEGFSPMKVNGCACWEDAVACKGKDSAVAKVDGK